VGNLRKQHSRNQIELPFTGVDCGSKQCKDAIMAAYLRLLQACFFEKLTSSILLANQLVLFQSIHASLTVTQPQLWATNLSMTPPM
jgi:hypothetical protein